MEGRLFVRGRNEVSGEASLATKIFPAKSAKGHQKNRGKPKIENRKTRHSQKF